MTKKRLTDKRRLDWLEAHPTEITYGGTFGLQYKWVQWPDEVGRADATLRAAIDFAMAAEGPAKGEGE